jgi:hypothetical protein
MPVTFGPTAPDQAGEIWQFLSGAFGLKEVPPAFTSAALSWKYFEPHPLWLGSRSYVMRSDDAIAAHGCVSPVRFLTGGGEVESMQIIDWAAGRLIPSAGLLLYRKCLEMPPGTLLAIGGSDDARKIIPQVKWFQRKDDIWTYARPLRPWRHFVLSGNSPRSFARLGRNVHWRLSPRLPGSGGWSCRRVRPAEEVFAPTGDFVPLIRTRAWFDYLLRCPLVKTELLILENAGVPQGHALLANGRGAVWVADFVVAGDASHPDRVAAFSAVVRHTAAQPDAAEILAGSSLRELCMVFEECGLRKRKASPVWLADRRKVLPANARLEITPMVGDLFYLFDPAYPFLC